MAQKDLKSWKPGQSGNPNGRPKGTGKPISRLRSMLKKLEEMSDSALDNIKKSVDGEEVDKTILDSSKYVINTVSSLTKACLQEEQFKYEIKKDAEEKENRANGTTGGTPVRPRFTTSIISDE